MHFQSGFARAIPVLVCPLVMVLCASASLAGVGQWTTNGPDGAPIFKLAAEPSAPSTLYASTPRHLYKSLDGGAHWTPTGLAAAVTHIVPAPGSLVVYALGFFPSTFFRSSDGGESWVSPAGPPGFLSVLAVDPNDPLTVYAGTSEGLFRSTDGGDGWDALLANPDVTALAIDPTDSRVLYRSTSFGILRSSDGGVTWTDANLRTSVNQFHFDPANPSRLFALTHQALLVTTNRGDSWQFFGFGLGGIDLAIDPSNSALLYIVTPSGSILRSSDGGATTTTIPETTFGGFVHEIQASATSILVGSGRGLARSDDGGRSWVAADVGIREVSVSSLAVDPTEPEVLFAAGLQGVYESRDGGDSWSPPVPSDPGAITIAIDPSDRSTLYIASGERGVQKSVDRGQTWQQKGVTDALGYISELVIDPSNPRRILSAYSNVYRSVDGAESWLRVLTPDDDYSSYYYPPVVNAIAIAPSESSTVYAGGWEGLAFLYRSDDGGDHWSALSVNAGVAALEVDSCDPQILQAGGFDGVRRTIDGGESWDPVGLPGVRVFALARDPRHSASMFAGTIAGLFWTNDRGATWARFEPRLDHVVHSIALDPSGRFLYAGTDHGVYVLERTFGACQPGTDRLCLIGAKFQVSVTARNPLTGATFAGTAIEEGDQFGYFSFPQVTGDPGFPEVFVKMVDAREAPAPFGGHAWVFHSSLTDLDYTLTVLETETGRFRTYVAADNEPLTCGLSDTSAFVRECTAAEASSRLPATLGASAPPSDTSLLLLNGRFRATLRATDPRTGRTAEGIALPRADGFGYFSLPGFTGDASFPEVFVKMTDARALPGANFWVFHAGLTDLQYTLTVTDLLTGASKTYSGRPGDAPRLCGGADTAAFR